MPIVLGKIENLIVRPMIGLVDGPPSNNEILYKRAGLGASRHPVRQMRRWSTFETIAARMLAREGVKVIWQLHLRAAASYGRGNWLSAAALVGITDTAERLWRDSA
jgi:hypothetical protein